MGKDFTSISAPIDNGPYSYVIVVTSETVSNKTCYFEFKERSDPRGWRLHVTDSCLCLIIVVHYASLSVALTGKVYAKRITKR